MEHTAPENAAAAAPSAGPEARDKRTAVFFGDSNTYGYDPRGFLGDRYPEDRIWTSLTARALGPGWEVRNRGANGRRIPRGPWDYSYAETLVRDLGPRDVFAVMLGSNDIFMMACPEAAPALSHMEALLLWLKEHTPASILILAPPYPLPEDLPEADDPDYDPNVPGASELLPYIRASREMNLGFGKLASRYGAAFADTAAWGVEQAFDQVHFTEEGHKTFAEHLIRLFDELY